jgi:hypothetical protein
MCRLSCVSQRLLIQIVMRLRRNAQSGRRQVAACAFKSTIEWQWRELQDPKEDLPMTVVAIRIFLEPSEKPEVDGFRLPSPSDCSAPAVVECVDIVLSVKDGAMIAGPHAMSVLDVALNANNVDVVDKFDVTGEFAGVVVVVGLAVGRSLLSTMEDVVNAVELAPDGGERNVDMTGE